MVSEEFVFGSSGLFVVTATHSMDDQVILSVQCRKTQTACPNCQVISNQLHSYYHRKIKDLPAFNNRVCLQLRARKWYCHNAQCKQKVFTERFECCVQPYKRFSNRLREKLLTVALLMGGNAGERLCRALNISTDSSTLLRLIHSQVVAEPCTSSAVGVDDWALKKGINYGTVIVDLEQHRIVDLLPDREAQTVENCLKDKPHVSIVTRDRFSPYANGIAGGLPHARQVADRWNPLKNREDALQQLLEKDKELAHDICKGSRDIQEARRGALKFRDMRENKQGHLVKGWISEVVASPQPE